MSNESQKPRNATTSKRLLRSMPTILVFAALIAIGLWGHHSGWKLPKFSELAGAAHADEEAWCAEHNVAAADCVSCNADLLPKGQLFGWCEEHGVHECVLHHPELVQLDEAPQVSEADMQRAARAIAMRPRTENKEACKKHLRRIQFSSQAAATRAGISTWFSERGPIVESVAATGEIIYDPTLVARLSSRAAGTVWRVEKNIGDKVKEGDVLALVDAADVGRAKADLLQSAAQLELRTKTHERLAKLGEDIVAGRRVQEAETARAEAEVDVRKAIHALANFGMFLEYDDVRKTPSDELRRTVRFLGLPAEIAKAMASEPGTSNLIPLLAPRDGLIVQRDVVAGEVIGTTKPLFTVADTSRMWLVLNVPLEEATHVTTGQKVVFRADGSTQEVTGKLSWMSTEVDAQTRTVMVRAELDNNDGRLRNETFGAGEIVLREEPKAILVPSTAVHWEGCCNIVFVLDRDYTKEGSYKLFHTRSVRPGVIGDEHTEIIAGIWPGEFVVTKGSGILRAELLKGNLGAG